MMDKMQCLDHGEAFYCRCDFWSGLFIILNFIGNSKVIKHRPQSVDVPLKQQRLSQAIARTDAIFETYRIFLSKGGGK